MKYVSYLFGGLSAAAAAGYLVVYLYRWEWQRALISGVLLLVVEGFLICLVILTRLGRLERRLQESDSRMEEVRRRLEQTRSTPAADHFDWLDSQGMDGTNRTFVFVPILMVTGAALSGLAWLIQKVAGATARPGAERRLAGRLSALTAPHEDAGRAVQLEDRLAVPPPHPSRTWLKAAGLVAGVALLGLLVTHLADLTETRDETAPKAVATTVVFQVNVRQDADGDQDALGPARDLAAQDLWETCRRSTAVGNYHVTLGTLDGNVYAGVLRPALAPHDLMRLRGCISDATANRATAKVLGADEVGLRP